MVCAIPRMGKNDGDRFENSVQRLESLRGLYQRPGIVAIGIFNQ